MFDLEAFVAECRRLVAEPHAPRHVLELMRAAVADPAAVALGTPAQGDIKGALDAPLFRSPELTVLHVVLRPGTITIPHDHRMWAVIGIYEGEETNTFYRGACASLETTNQRTIHTGEAILLGEDVIHAIENPLPTETRGLHVYGGDLLGAARTMWDPMEWRPEPYDVPKFYEHNRALARSRRAVQDVS